jgi:hypothetical protein
MRLGAIPNLYATVWQVPAAAGKRPSISETRIEAQAHAQRLFMRLEVVRIFHHARESD